MDKFKEFNPQEIALYEALEKVIHGTKNVNDDEVFFVLSELLEKYSRGA